MISIEEELTAALARLNHISETLNVVKDMVDRAEYKMAVEEYFHTLLTLEKVKEAIVSLEKVYQKQRGSDNH